MSLEPRLLVIDDNAINLALMAYLLEASGFRAVSAAHGQSGLDHLAQDWRFDAILCDIQMPVMDGIEFARRVKAEPAWSQVPLVAITALAMVGDRDRILAAGFDAYITKPIEPASFVASLNEAVPSLRARLQPAGAASGAERPTILALDDTPYNLELKRSLLLPLGYQVLTAETPAAAMELARAHHPDLIISDIGMHAGSGFDFIAMVKADPALRDVPFIFLSATHWDDESRRKGMALGATSYLNRPIASEILLKEIRTCLGE